MRLFGDESGHLRSLLDGERDLFVLGVVAGDASHCAGPARQVVRRVRDLEEAKWIDLNSRQKERVVSDFADRSGHVPCGYVALRRRDLLGLPNSYLLYQNEGFPCDWDLWVMGVGYAELLHALTDGYNHFELTFDRIFQRRQSDEIVEVICDRLPQATVRHSRSHGVRGIQTADCVAGALAEHLRDGTGWLTRLEDVEIVDATDWTLAQLEMKLHDVDTGP